MAAQSSQHWYAVQTCSRHEKRVRDRLAERAIETFLPLYETKRRWKDRNIDLQLPLFPGYIFLRMHIGERLRVLQVSGVVRFVGFGGGATPLLDEEIVSLRQGLVPGLQVEPCSYLKVGRRVRVKSGPLQGMEGFLLKRKNRERFVISLDLIMRSVAVEMDVLDLEPLGVRAASA